MGWYTPKPMIRAPHPAPGVKTMGDPVPPSDIDTRVPKEPIEAKVTHPAPALSPESDLQRQPAAEVPPVQGKSALPPAPETQPQAGKKDGGKQGKKGT